MMKMTMMGGQSRSFFIWVAQQLGYTITIREYSPFMVGISRVGLTLDDQGYPKWQIGPPEMRFLLVGCRCRCLTDLVPRDSWHLRC